MPREHDIVFPPKGHQTFEGGLNNKFERYLISENESPDCANVVFENGAVETRQGYSKLNSTAVGSFVGDGLYTRHANTGAETMVAFMGGTMWTWGGSTFSTVASAQSVFTAGVRVATTEYENHMFIGNGAVGPYKYNGTDFTLHGVPAATGAVSVATAGTGSALSASVQYKITYVNSQQVEGDVGTATVTLTLASENAHLTDIPTAPQSYGVAARRIYRSDDGADFQRVAEISDNSTTEYEDAIVTLGADAPTDNGVPPKYDTVVAHHDRVFCNDASNRNFLWYSDLGEPYTYQSTNFLKIGDNTSDLIQALAVYSDGLVVKCTRSVWMVVFGGSTDPSNWQLIRLRVPYGSKSPHGCFLYENRLMIPAMQNDKFVGYVAIQGGAVDPDATYLENSVSGSDRKSDRIEPDIFAFAESLIAQVSSIVFQNKAYTAVPYGASATENNRVYVYDFSRSTLSKKQEAAWSPLTGISAEQFTVYDGKLYFISSLADGFVYQLQDGTYNDDSGAIDSYFWTKEFSGNRGHESDTKDFRKLRLLVEKTGAYFMSVFYRVDSDKGQGKQKQINLDPGSSLWGTLRWGIDEYGGGQDQEEIEIPLGSSRGKRIQFKFSNQNAADQRFKVHGLKFTYNLVGRR